MHFNLPSTSALQESWDFLARLTSHAPLLSPDDIPLARPAPRGIAPCSSLTRSPHPPAAPTISRTIPGIPPSRAPQVPPTGYAAPVRPPDHLGRDFRLGHSACHVQNDLTPPRLSCPSTNPRPQAAPLSPQLFHASHTAAPLVPSIFFGQWIGQGIISALLGSLAFLLTMYFSPATRARLPMIELNPAKFTHWVGYLAGGYIAGFVGQNILSSDDLQCLIIGALWPFFFSSLRFFFSSVTLFPSSLGRFLKPGLTSVLEHLLAKVSPGDNPKPTPPSKDDDHTSDPENNGDNQ